MRECRAGSRAVRALDVGWQLADCWRWCSSSHRITKWEQKKIGAHSVHGVHAHELQSPSWKLHSAYTATLTSPPLLSASLYMRNSTSCIETEHCGMQNSPMNTLFENSAPERELLKPPWASALDRVKYHKDKYLGSICVWGSIRAQKASSNREPRESSKDEMHMWTVRWRTRGEMCQSSVFFNQLLEQSWAQTGPDQHKWTDELWGILTT